MGGAPSKSRTISMTNPEQSVFIKVSDSVVQRIEGRSVTSTPTLSHSPPAEPIKEEKQEVRKHHPRKEEKPFDNRKQDVFWQERMKEIQRNTARDCNKIYDEEYQKAVSEVNTKFTRKVTKKAGQPCRDLQSSVLECYTNNPGMALLCSNIVNDFAACVDANKLNI